VAGSFSSAKRRVKAEGVPQGEEEDRGASLGLSMVRTVRGLARGSWVVVPEEFPSGVDQHK